MTTFISRRELLKAAAMAPVGRVLWTRLDAGSQGPGLQPGTLTSREMEILNAIAGRLIPNDELGPGAVDAGVTHYIDAALGGALSSSRPAYAAGLAAVDKYAQSSRGKAFTDLSPTDQDSVLIDVESGTATGFTGSPAQFFAMVLGHTHQGMFGDPFYGGNKDFAGWDLIRYPGVRTMVTATDQKNLEAQQLKPNHKSAYDYDSFTKADPHHGE
ncbi:MAG TPA: gluconate 2-dehydrogenase subunit 3 family protein [Vicinamibacterales bacterium]|nr:gluconate 2-dehydrogenase subunit 3 family protein [Vicinamibacterales bacterium]